MSGYITIPGARRSASRTSLVSVGRMPIIAEDENQQPTQQQPPTRPPHRRAVSMPTYTTLNLNLRRPNHIAGKAVPGSPVQDPNGRPTPPIPERSSMRPAALRPPSSHGRLRPASFAGPVPYDPTLTQAHGIQVPPYSPPYPPPDYYSRPSRDSAGGRFRNSLRPAPAAGGADPPDRNPPLKYEHSSMEKIKESPWVARRGGWRRILLILAIIVIIIVALAVGLTLGLRDRNSNSSSSRPADDSSPPVFPAGSFAFQTALTNVSTFCTSDAATWRCNPYVTYGDADPSSEASASFFWTILPPDPAAGRPGYTVSSADNPFAPRFANASMTMRDGNTPDERLFFEVEMNRTVVPAPGMAGFSDGVSCEYASVFRGIAWTARVPGGGDERDRANVTATGGGGGNDGKWSPWPGEVEVEQVATGGPRCTDVSGDVVPVDAGDGECLCRYANYDLDG